MSIITALAAIALAAVIVGRVVCVVYQAAPRHHRHLLQFLGFGYSYVVLGAGAIAAAVAICADSEAGPLALWLLLAGSCGLIAFDRRSARCWQIAACPADAERGRDPP